MKITQNLGVSSDPERLLSGKGKNKNTPIFQKILQEKQDLLTKDRLQSLLSELNQYETHLSISRSMQDLLNYKQAISKFIHEVVQNGLSLEEHYGHDANGRERRLKIIKQVDRKLLELSDQVLETQAPAVELLEKMGEIKGLLLNMYY